MLNHFCSFVYLSTFTLGRALLGAVRDVDVGVRVVRIVLTSSFWRSLAVDCIARVRVHPHRSRVSPSALSHSVVPLVTKIHVDERTGIFLLLWLKSLCLHGRRHSAVVSLRACVFVCQQAICSVRWPQCGDCGRRASTCRRRALPDLSPASSSPRSYLWVSRPSPWCWKGGVGVSADLGGRPFSSAAVAALAMSCVDSVHICGVPKSVEGLLATSSC